MGFRVFGLRVEGLRVEGFRRFRVQGVQGGFGGVEGRLQFRPSELRIRCCGFGQQKTLKPEPLNPKP